VSFQSRASGANSSQLDRSKNFLRRWDLRGNTKMGERLIDVWQTIAFSHSATSQQ
jgi:hypothetical protein